MVQKKMDEFQIPSDLERIPGKIHAGKGFSNFTADQWRIFFTIYATVSLWKYLSEIDRKILAHFVRICSLLGNRIQELDSMQEANRRLIEIVKLIETNYGRDKSHRTSIYYSIYTIVLLLMDHYMRSGVSFLNV